MDNRFFKLPLQFELDRLRADLDVCEARQWVGHFNKNDYDGNWSGISLRSPSGNAADIFTSSSHTYEDTPLLNDCPYFQEILASLPFEKETVRLLALAPGSVIREHSDKGLGYEFGAFRLHIPILTDEGVQFTVDGCNLDMAAGQCWYANFNLPHSVRHEGHTRRIHLVIDGIRGAGSDALFGGAGFDFEQERKQKEHDPATKAAMIEHLKLIDSDAARSLILQLEASLRGTAADQQQPDYTDCIPSGLVRIEDAWLCQWMQTGGISYTAPFFDQTIGRIKTLPANKSSLISCSTLQFLTDQSQNIDFLPPDAFIFHVSRCGSTLLSQMLGTDRNNIVLAEVPILDELLRLPHRDSGVDTDFAAHAFAAALRWMGRKRSGAEQGLFIKTDCWHVFFYETIRKLYPEVPIVLLYRNPAEVLRSQQKLRGIQSMNITLEPSLTGIAADAFEAYDFDGYFSKLLEHIFSRFVAVANADKNTFLLNYAEGVAGMLEKTERATGRKFSSEQRKAMEKRSLFHGKKQGELFIPETEALPMPTFLEPALFYYQQLETQRLGQKKA
jgi:Aspartyl/Asparaginyl beta-hydroxylase